MTNIVSIDSEDIIPLFVAISNAINILSLRFFGALFSEFLGTDSNIGLDGSKGMHI